MPKRKKRFILESPELDLYSSCLTESTDPNIIDDRIQLNYTSLAEFVDLYTVNTYVVSFTVLASIRYIQHNYVIARAFQKPTAKTATS